MSKTQPAPAAPGKEIVLQLGDLLTRIPEEYLLPGPHDPRQPVRFKVEELADFMGTGKSTMSLERLALACPNVIRPDAAMNVDVPFPIQKVMGQIPHNDAAEPREGRQRLLFGARPSRPANPDTPAGRTPPPLAARQ